ncbi:MAG: TIGR03086 family protein [Chloroflexi bacterium]|nr:TIGR03086 family protein [Chloroflexota bacterium]
MAQGPDPVEIYEQAWAQLRPILAASSGQHGSSTPCTEWNVQSLINHALAVQNFAYSTLSKASFDMSTMGAVDHAFPSEGAEAAFKAITESTLATLKSINLADTVETAFGSMPGGQFIMVPITDMIIHTWDLAKATGQNSTLDNGLAEIGYNVIANVAAGGRERGAFGPEVVIPDTASFQDRLLGMSGRTP